MQQMAQRGMATMQMPVIWIINQAALQEHKEVSDRWWETVEGVRGALEAVWPLGV